MRGGLQGSAAGGALQCPEHLLRLRGKRLYRACVLPGLADRVSGEIGADLLGCLSRVEAAGWEDADRAVEHRRGDLDSISLRDGAVDGDGGVVAVAAGEGEQLADLPFVEFVSHGR